MSTIDFSGNEALSQQPDEDIQPTYSLGNIQSIPDSESIAPFISEPHHLYRLADGRLVMSRECRNRSDRPERH
ncbi:MAG: hypothetical protein F6K11_12290 [Leptolyngbya sp. SIO3F4]|nr:hypothetical protein [Leptolyngbya sp. SIO3F4]